MSVMQLSIMEHNGIYLKEKLLMFASIAEKHNGVSFEHNFLMPILCMQTITIMQRGRKYLYKKANAYNCRRWSVCHSRVRSVRAVNHCFPCDQGGVSYLCHL